MCACLAAGGAGPDVWLRLGVGAMIFIGVTAMVMFWWEPLRRHIARQEEYYDRVLRRSLLMAVNPRTVTLGGLGLIVLGAIIALALIPHPLVALIGGAVGAAVLPLTVRYLRHHRLYRLEDQLVDGIQTLISGVRAGLNLIQAMELLAENGVRPISEEFAHLTSEYEHGVPLERAMESAAGRIGSSNYRLLFAALLTHRERGGDLSQTLDRIAESIREIHRLEKRVETLTAPGRTAARWMGLMPAVIMLILYFIFPLEIELLFTTPVGRTILIVIAVLNLLGFLWIRKIVSIDI